MSKVSNANRRARLHSLNVLGNTISEPLPWPEVPPMEQPLAPEDAADLNEIAKASTPIPPKVEIIQLTKVHGPVTRALLAPIPQTPIQGAITLTSMGGGAAVAHLALDATTGGTITAAAVAGTVASFGNAVMNEPVVAAEMANKAIYPVLWVVHGVASRLRRFGHASFFKGDK